MIFQVFPLVHSAKQTLIIGDEKSIPLAHALFSARPEIVLWTHVLLEVWAVMDAESTLERLHLPRATLIQRQADDSHLEHLESVARSHAVVNVGAKYVLTGRASTICRISGALFMDGVRRHNICKYLEFGAQDTLERPSFIPGVWPFVLVSSDTAVATSHAVEAQA
jgi:hypothetical protein